MPVPEPQRLGSADLVGRLQKIITTRGIQPVDIADEPDPGEPGHPAYHHRQRVDVATRRWATATPRRYRHATATDPRVLNWARTVADAWAKPEPHPDINPAAEDEPLPSLLLTGPTGTGKTHQAYGALRHIAQAGPRRYGLIATTAADMYGALRPGGAPGEAEYALKRLAEIPLLLLDDLGSAKASEWTEEVTYRVINERYNQCRPTLFTSNLPPRAPRDDQGRPTGPDLTGTLGDRIASRLAQMTTVVDIVGTDRRRTPHGDAA